MPLTKKGHKIMSNMQQQYGSKKGKSVFYASRNKGTISGVDPEGSLEDITFHEEAAERDTVMNGETQAHPIHKGYDDCVPGTDNAWKEDGDEPKGSEHSSNRDNGYGIHYGAPVDYFGPDTEYRAEEINPQDYGRDYDPFPFRDMFKDQKKDTRPNLRLLEEREYEELRTPGTVNNKSFEDSMAYGSISYEKVPVETDDYRGFESQQKFRRNAWEPDEDTPKVSGRDTKLGKNIR